MGTNTMRQARLKMRDLARSQPKQLVSALTIALLAVFLSKVALSAVAEKDPSTADHSKFEQLKGPFADGPAVTKACLECHTEAAKQLHKTSHWTWAFENPVTGQMLGKKNVVNNFCVATAYQLATLYQLSHRLWLEGRLIRSELGDACRLPGLS